MLDKDRILTKVDELDAYLNELKQIAPPRYGEYQQIEKKRSCERLLQLCIECVIDVCKLLVAQLRLGLPSEENDLFTKLENKGLLSHQVAEVVRQMRGSRNILIHEYAAVDDELIYTYVSTRLGDFEGFEKEILTFLKAC
ncbi:MAG: DUF86 domain-containing protein [Syntrophorhabdales bacterium]|jgi:uncharacterized protein YutE (UPF0331/DUF86 family)